MALPLFFLSGCFGVHSAPTPPTDSGPPPSPGPDAGDDAGENLCEGPLDHLDACTSRTGTTGVCVDGTCAAPRCDPTEPFGAPELVGVGDTGVDVDGWLSSEELTLYFRSDRAGSASEDLYAASRTTTSGTFGAPALIPNVNSYGYENGVVLPSDGLSLYLGSTRAGAHDIYVATRAAAGDDFGAPTLLANVNDAGANDVPTWIDADSRTLYFWTDRGTSRDMYVATRTGPTASFGAPQPIAGINDATANDWWAVLSSDGLTIYFLSDRAGGAGGADIWTATRATFADDFSGV